MAGNGDLALVTGASGFIGAAVVRRLLKEGFSVRALLRPNSSHENIPAGCALHFGDVTDPDSVRAAMSDARYVFHLAADYRLCPRDPQALIRINVDGSEAVMRAALAAGVERVVHTSSVATLAANNEGICTEELRLAAEQAIGAYKRSKILSEQLVESMIKQDGLPAVIVCPSAPLGPGDIRPTPTGRIVREALRGRMPAYVDTGLNIVHVDDVAQGQLAALRRGVVGERYILGGENLTLRDLLTEISRIAGRPAPKLRLPYWPLLPLAFVNEMAARATGSEPFLNRESLRLSATRMFFDDAKARAALGYETRPARDAIADSVRWFRNRGAGEMARGCGDMRADGSV